MVRKGYKQTDIGVIPEDWGVTCLDLISRLSSGTTPSRAQDDRYYRNGEYHWVKTTDLNNSQITATEEKITKAALDETCLQIYPLGTVLVAMYGGFNQIGRTGLIRVPAAVNQALVAIQAKRNKLEPAYLLANLNYRVDHWKLVASSSRKDPNITSQDVRDFVLPLPELKEQRFIAQALSDVDALIAALDKLIAKKRNLKTATMQQLLTGKKRLPWFDEEWQTFKVSDLFEITAGGDLVKSEYSNINDDVHPYAIYANSVFNSGIYGYSRFKEYEGGCITVTARGTLGIAYHRATPFVAIGRLIVLKPKGELDSFFLSELINHRIKFANESTGVPQLTAPQISKCELSIPAIEEQSAIATVLSDMDAEITALKSHLVKTQAIKQGMMQELLTGRTRLINNHFAENH